MISDKKRRRAVTELREASTGAYRHVDSLDVIANSIGVEVDGKFSHEVENETYAALADFIDRPIGRPLIPDAMEGNVFCPRCGAEIGEYGVPNYCHECGLAISAGRVVEQ